MKDNAELSTTFNSSGTDTFVFLHMQKTGGTTLGIRLVKDIGKFFFVQFGSEISKKMCFFFKLFIGSLGIF